MNKIRTGIEKTERKRNVGRKYQPLDRREIERKKKKPKKWIMEQKNFYGMAGVNSGWFLVTFNK